MTKISREIDLKNLVRELAHNKVDALELIREALSNARDHDARRVWLRTVKRPAPSLATDIFVINDGKGMTQEQLQAFWGVSASVKDEPARAIGYKGHGSKLFYSCRKLSVATRLNERQPWRLTELDEPLESSAQDIPSMELPTDHPLRAELEAVGLDTKVGVAVLVEGCKFHDVDRFTRRRTVESYCDWFTIVGDIRSGVFKKREEFHAFVEQPDDLSKLRVSERALHVLDVYLRINGETLYEPIGRGKAKPAADHLEPWRADSDHWFKSGRPGMAAFGHRFADHFESEAGGAKRVRDDRTALCLVAVDQFADDASYGLVMRVEGQRRQLDSYPEGSRQPRGGEFDFTERFGLWLCRDFVPVVQRNDLLARALERATEKARKRLRFDLSKTRCWQIFINHQDFLLTANRNDITNASQHEEPIVELVGTRIADALSEDSFREWIENLQRAVAATKRSKELSAIQTRLSEVTSWFKKPAKDDVDPAEAKGLEVLDVDASLRLPPPTNEQELFHLYTLMSGRFRMPLRVIDYDTRFGIDAIAQVQDAALFPSPIAYARVEFKQTVRANVAIGHFFDAIDAIVCWTVSGGSGALPEAGDTPLPGQLDKRAHPRLPSKLDTHEVTYQDEHGKKRVIPVLVLRRAFA